MCTRPRQLLALEYFRHIDSNMGRTIVEVGQGHDGSRFERLHQRRLVDSAERAWSRSAYSILVHHDFDEASTRVEATVGADHGDVGLRLLTRL